MAGELWQKSAAELAELVRTKQASSREIVQAHLDRIDAVNAKLNAVTVVLAEEAIKAAEAADAAVVSGAALGPLHGVPMTVKENIDLAGSPTTQGIVAMAEAMPALDAPHIAQMKAAGAIPIARTNMPDFGMRWHTDNALRGATKNPWDASRSPGGSSGGDAVALATGMTPLGMGNDYGGSLRLPSQACGTAALRPTHGRVPSATSLEPSDFPITIQLFAVQGPMARRVRDLRVALEAMSGPDARDPWWTPAPLRGPEPEKPIRVAMTVDPTGEGVDPDVAAGVRQAAKALSDAGYAVEEVQPPVVQDAARLWEKLIMTEMVAGLLPVLQQIASPDAVKFLNDGLEVMSTLDASGYIMGFAERNAHARAWAQFFERYPLVLGPVTTQQPTPVGFDVGGPDNIAALLRAHRLMVTVNLLGLPAAAIPTGVANGLPQGVQVIGARYREDLCLDAAQAIEDQLGIFTPIDPLF